MSLATSGKTKRIIDAATTKIFEKLAAGWSDERVRKDLNLDPDQYRSLRRIMLDNKASEIRGKTQDQIYIEYLIEQRSVIRTLDNVVKELAESNQHNARIGALRLRAFVVDRILDRAQEFGIVNKAPEKKLVGTVIVSDMSNPDLIQAIQNQVETFQLMMNSYGEKSILALPSKPTHYGPTVDEDSIEAEGEDADDLDDEEELSKSKSKPKTKAKAKSKK
jgi:hypothetical protein